MTEHNFKVTTELDDSGLRRLESELDRIQSKVRSIGADFAKWSAGTGTVSSSMPVAAGGPASSRSGRASGPRGASGGGQRYDLDTVAGVYAYDVDVLQPVDQMFSAGQRKGASRTKSAGNSKQPPGFWGAFQQTALKRRYNAPAPIATQSSSPKTVASMPSAGELTTWLAELGPKYQSMTREQQVAYGRAIQSSDTGGMQEFWQNYGSQLGAPGIHTTVPVAPAGSGSGGAGGRGGGSVLGSEAGAAIGTLAKRYLPVLTIAGATTWAAGQVSQGYDMWKQSAASFSELSHSLQSTAKNVETFRQQVSMAGASFGESLQQSAASALSFTQAFGGMSNNRLTSLVGSNASWALQSGIGYQQANQIISTSAALGLTSGVGSTLSPAQFQNALSNMTTSTNMQGRQGSLYTGMMDVFNTIGGTNPVITNPLGLAGMYQQMNATGVQGLQGMRGASLLSHVSSSIMNPNAFAQNLMGAAIYQATGGTNSNPIDWQYLEQQGPQTVIPGTHTTLATALITQIKKQTSNPTLQRYMLAQALSISQPQAEQLLHTSGFGTTSASPKQVGNKPWYSLSDMRQITNAKKTVGQSSAGSVVAPFTTAINAMGFGGQMVLGLGGSMLAAKYGSKLLTKVGATTAGKGILSRITSLFGAGGEAAAGDAAATVATDAGTGMLVDAAGGLGAAGGLEALGFGLDSTGIGAIAGIPLGLLGAYFGYRALNNATGASSNAKRAQQQSQIYTQSRVTSTATNAIIPNLTIQNLQVQSMSLPKGASSFNRAFSGSGSGSNWGPVAYINGQPVSGPPAPGGYTPTGQVTSAPYTINRYLSTINSAAAKAGTPSQIVAGIMMQESGGNPYVINDNTSGHSYHFASQSSYLMAANQLLARHDSIDMGLMQINSKAHPNVSPAQAANPSFAIPWAANYLRSLYNTEHGNWDSAIQAYNTGSGGVGSAVGMRYLESVLAKERQLQVKNTQQVSIHPSSVQHIARSISAAVSRPRSVDAYHKGLINPW